MVRPRSAIHVSPGMVSTRGAMFGRRQRRVRRPLLLSLVALLLVVPVAVAGRDDPARSTPPALAAEPPSSSAEGDLADMPSGTAGPAAEPFAADRDGSEGHATAAAVRTVFARYGGLDFVLPSDGVLLVAFHEAALADALAMEPVGRVLANENRTKFAAPGHGEGPGYVVLSSRGRRQAATSAADLVLRDDDPVRSLVTGRVVDVRPYALYGRYADTRIEIAPAADPDLRVVLIHVAGVTVRAGDAVVAGETVLAASANRFPFASHVDRYFEHERWPHVHVEVKHAEEGGGEEAA